METGVNLLNQKSVKKENRGLIIAGVILVLLAVLVVLGIGVYKDFTKKTTPVDLGVSYNSDSSNGNIVNQIITDTCDAATCTIDNSRLMVLYLTNEEASSLVNSMKANTLGVELSDTQIKFGSDNTKVSTVVNVNNTSYTVYAEGNVSKASATTVSITLSELKVNGLEIPQYMRNVIAGEVTTAVNNYLASLGSDLDINELTTSDNQLYFKGIFPIQKE